MPPICLLKLGARKQTYSKRCPQKIDNYRKNALKPPRIKCAERASRPHDQILFFEGVDTLKNPKKGADESRLIEIVIRMGSAPQGFEPRYAAPEAAVLPLNEGATCEAGSLAALLSVPPESPAARLNLFIIRAIPLPGQTAKSARGLLFAQHLKRPQSENPIAGNPARGSGQNRGPQQRNRRCAPVDVEWHFHALQQHARQPIGKNRAH